MTYQMTSCLRIGRKGTVFEMMTRREVIRLSGSVMVAVFFTAVPAGLSFSIVPSASAARFQTAGPPQKTGALSVPVDSPRGALEGQAKTAEYQGRECLFLDGGAAILKDLEMRDGVIDVDVATPASRGFFGIQFRIANDGANAEWVYLRQHKSGLPDAMQYTPVLNTGANWQIIMGQASPARSISRKTKRRGRVTKDYRQSSQRCGTPHCAVLL